MRRALTLCTALLLSAALFGQAPRRAPGFSLPDSKGQQHDLQDYRGKVVIVDIMRSDCVHCQPFAKKLEQIKTFNAGKVAVISITNPPDSPAAVNKFIAAQKLTFPVLFDCGQVAFSYVRPSPLKPSINIPHLFLIDRDGFIVKDFEFGPDTTEIFQGDGLQAEIDKLLAAKPAQKR
ncbi:MAG: peroxiredoxin family protein [Acidobacteriota bacterium]